MRFSTTLLILLATFGSISAAAASDDSKLIRGGGVGASLPKAKDDTVEAVKTATHNKVLRGVNFYEADFADIPNNHQYSFCTATSCLDSPCGNMHGFGSEEVCTNLGNPSYPSCKPDYICHDCSSEGMPMAYFCKKDTSTHPNCASNCFGEESCHGKKCAEGETCYDCSGCATCISDVSSTA